ncbi:MAG: response regulator [Bacteroidota bacterium]
MGVLIEKIEKEEFPLNGIKVLLVEDNFFNQLLAAKVLENWECIVDVAANGNIAISKVKDNDFDIILMDIQLPELNGYDATSYIRSKIPEPKCNIPIIAMSANIFEEEIKKCFECGMNDYVSKPFVEHILYEKILKAIQPS